MPTHLPSMDLLAEYASGAAPVGTSLLIACQLTKAPESRARVGEMERIGGALLKDEAAAPLSDQCLEAVMARLDDAPCATSCTNTDGPLPQPLVKAIPVPFDDIPWSFRLPGVHEYILDGYGEEKVSILRARPGSAVPQHTHRGRELTLVMSGVLQDGDGVYRAGDVASNDEDDDHRPRIIGDEMCYCLTVLNGNLHFTGTFSRALNILGQ